ncbi:MAG TPA: insulinase family protein [Candidatus Marinimicrobia bacterium]|nr:insulinase family protein [Candidatus Neomarinimicrobiota bacterium]
MKINRPIWLILIIGIILLASCSDKTVIKESVEIDLFQEIPLDPKILKGTLENGMTYYIRENKKPEERAELRLAVNAGATLEDDSQKGFAHLLEHLHFNGMEDYPYNSLIDTLERIGIRFGHDLNAYTSFDETVYMLQIPTDSLELLKMGVNILENWAFKLLFDSLEVEKEKGVVIEEFRYGRSARARMFDEHIKVLFEGSRYADRLTIGDTLIIRQAPHSEIKRYYKDWYRPDLMAVLAIGDFDADSMLVWIRNTFSPYQGPESPRERELFTVPDNDKPLYSIVTDKEATTERVSVYYKKAPTINKTAADYRLNLVENLYFRMLNARLGEINRNPEAPFVRASAGKGSYVRTVDVFGLNVMSKPGRLLESLETILTEAERAERYGFLPSELERAKKQLLTGYRRSYTERDKRESTSIASEYIRNFLRFESLPGIEWEYKLAQQEVPNITLEEVMAVSEGLMTDHNRIVLVELPEKEDIPVPTEEELEAIFSSVAGKEIEPYTETELSEPLISDLPEPGFITDEKEYSSLGVTEWKLSNGVTVVLKPTDFKNDEIQFHAVSPGGWSLAPTESLQSAKLGAQLISQSGLGPYDATALLKYMAGKSVRVNPYIAILSEGLRGNSTVDDVETMFEMIYSYIMEPRTDSTAFQTLVEQQRARLFNAASDPESVYNDSIIAIIYDHHPRRAPMMLDDLDDLDMITAIEFYKDRFADAGDFVFVFVGNFTTEDIKPYIEQYIATLPSTGRQESWMDEGVRYAEGPLLKSIYRGSESKSNNFILLHSPFEYSPDEEFYTNALNSVLRARLREVIREESSGTYGVSVRNSISRHPVEQAVFQFYFSCEPVRVEELTGKLFEELERIRNGELDPAAVDKVREIEIRQRQNNLKNNGFWLNELKNTYFYGDDINSILQAEEFINSLTKDKVVEKAVKYLNAEKYLQIILYPESE